MKLKNYISILILLISVQIFSQEKHLNGYRVEGDEVVFRFDKRDYTNYTDEKNQAQIDFKDFDIENVVVSGEFNLWSRDSWKMKKVNDNIYELRKKLSDFKDNFLWEFKFVINNHIWAEPNNEMSNISAAKDHLGKYLATYNLRFYNSQINEEGNAKFFLEGFEDAKKVVLAGSFNKWNEELYSLQKRDNGWGIKLKLPAGVYEYKFIVDGEWMADPANANKVRNEFLGFNSVIEIDTEVTFILPGYDDADKVVLAGDFNDWSPSDYHMKKTDKGWIFTTRLVGGKYHYKFIVDGNWMTDPNNKVKEYDGKGNINSVKMVR